MPYNRLQNELYARARELIGNGRLPCATPVGIWGGYGSGLLCSLCNEVIQRDQVEYEIEFECGDGRKTYRFHFLCHAAWQVECAREQTMGSR